MHASNISALMAHVICKGGVYNCILIAVRPPGKICPSNPKSGGILTHVAICCFVIGAQITTLNIDYTNYGLCFMVYGCIFYAYMMPLINA